MAILDISSFEPLLNGRDWAVNVSSHYRDSLTRSLLVCFGPSDGHAETIGRFLEISNGQGHQLATAKSARKTKQEQCPIPLTNQAIWAMLEHFAETRGGGRRFSGWFHSNPVEDAPDSCRDRH